MKLRRETAVAQEAVRGKNMWLEMLEWGGRVRERQGFAGSPK